MVPTRVPVYPGELADRPSRHFEADPEVGWRMRPGVRFAWTVEGQRALYAADANGMRTDPHRTSRGGFERRLCLAGDSFAFGIGVDYRETFGARLTERFASIELCNVAMPGFGLDQIWMSVRHRALPRDPQAILVTFIDQDLNRSLTAYRRIEGFNKPTFTLDCGRLRPLVAADRPGWIGSALRDLRVHRLLERTLERAGRHLPVGALWTRNAAILGALREDCRAAGVPVFFVRLPTLPTSAFPQLARSMQETGSHYLDLGSFVPEGLHFEHDMHLTAAGHRWVAERIGSWLPGHLDWPLRRFEWESETGLARLESR